VRGLLPRARKTGGAVAPATTHTSIVLVDCSRKPEPVVLRNDVSRAYARAVRRRIISGGDAAITWIARWRRLTETLAW